MLALSSSDGYCSFVIFEKGELGEIYEPTGELANQMKVQEYVPQQMKPATEPAMQETERV
jgi:hypothetical protein